MKNIAQTHTIKAGDYIHYKLWKHLNKKLLNSGCIIDDTVFQNNIRNLFNLYRKNPEKYREISKEQSSDMQITDAQKSDCVKINKISIDNATKDKVKLNINGVDNQIKIGKIRGNGDVCLSLVGDNNKVCIGDIYVSNSLNIVLGQDHYNFGKIHNTELQIGNNTTFERAVIKTFNSNNRIKIGSRCMFSYGITLYNTDAHPIYKKGTEKIINKVRDMVIGSHVWCGANVTILKNTIIANNCVLGCGSVISGKFLNENCIIAGNPAKVIRTDIDWNFNGSKGYVQNE